MKRRWRLWLGLALFLLLAGSLCHPAVHWRLIGWARQEAFYENRPTSWWVSEIELHYIGIVETWAAVRDFPEPADMTTTSQLVGWTRESPQSWWDWRPDWWYAGQAKATFVFTINESPTLVNGDRDALPVLLELIRRPELKARQVAVSGLAALQSREPAVIAALLEALWDADPAIRNQADQAIRRIIPEPAPPPEVDKGP